MKKLNSIKYYQAMYVERGKSGSLSGSRATQEIYKDALSLQKDMARRISDAVVVEADDSNKK